MRRCKTHFMSGENQTGKGNHGQAVLHRSAYRNVWRCQFRRCLPASPGVCLVGSLRYEENRAAPHGEWPFLISGRKRRHVEQDSAFVCGSLIQPAPVYEEVPEMKMLFNLSPITHNSSLSIQEKAIMMTIILQPTLSLNGRDGLSQRAGAESLCRTHQHNRITQHRSEVESWSRVT
jgi:hypothetical protein